MTDFEQVLRTGIRDHMGGAAPNIDWAAAAITVARRRRRRAATASAACLVLVAGVAVAGLIYHRGTSIRQDTEPATQPDARQTGVVGSGLVIQGASGHWNISVRTTTDPAAAICLDLRRNGITDKSGNPQPTDLCAPADPSYTSYHFAYVDFVDDQASIEFGRVPAGTTRVDVVGGTSVRATLAPIPGTTIVVWAAETPDRATAATATLSNGHRVDLRRDLKHGCQLLAQNDIEIPATSPCVPAASEPPTTPTVPVQSRYASDETFCSPEGTLSYVVRAGAVTLTSTLTGLPANAQLLVNWSNDTVRGYAIAGVATGADGRFDTSTLSMFRPAEQHGVRIELTDGPNDSTLVRILTACSTPPATQVATDPSVQPSPGKHST